MNKNYISAEQFLEQSKEVQKVFLDWWKPQIGERIYSNGISSGEYILLNPRKPMSNVYDVFSLNTNNISMTARSVFIPLFSETQLRNFIKYFLYGDMTFIECLYYYNNDNNYGYEIKPTISDSLFHSYQTNEQDLLEAYWSVACKIGEEIVSKTQEN